MFRALIILMLSFFFPASQAPRRMRMQPLPVLERRALQRTYGERGAEILALLEANPHAAVPVVLARLEAKAVEWRRAQREWSRVWREVAAANFSKAHDHQSFAFKMVGRSNRAALYL